MLYATTQVLIMVSAANEEESRFFVLAWVFFYCLSPCIVYGHSLHSV